jgi:hypothetical protein
VVNGSKGWLPPPQGLSHLGGNLHKVAQANGHMCLQLSALGKDFSVPPRSRDKRLAACVPGGVYAIRQILGSCACFPRANMGRV